MKEIQDIFVHHQADENKLLSYGFVKKDSYFYQTNIMNDDFRLDFYFDGKEFTRIYIYDNQWDDEYFDINSDATYENVNAKIREEIVRILEDMRDKCFDEAYFSFPQTNRLVEYIHQKWGILPDFPWPEYDYGVVRNLNNQKWFGLIMPLDAKLLKEESRMVDVINIKANPEEIPALVEKKGIYTAYHMNKKSWISIVLDDTLSDEELFSLLEWSYHSVEDKKKNSGGAILIPSNPYIFDIEKELKDTGSILWENRCHAKKGDLAYIYYAQPYSAIILLCKVEEVGIENPFNTSAKTCMKLVQIKKFSQNDLPLAQLKEHGLTSVRCQRRISPELFDYLQSF